MNPSLSVILPAYNAEQQLKPRVLEMLEVLADLRTPFELLIVDDGSTDHTVEVAGELAGVYPQVRLVRTGKSRGLVRACLLGIERTAGETILLRDLRVRLRASEIVSLWATREDPDLVAAQSARGEASEPFIRQLLTAARDRSARSTCSRLTGVHLIRRRAFQELCRPSGPPEVRRITRTDLAQGGVQRPTREHREPPADAPQSLRLAWPSES